MPDESTMTVGGSPGAAESPGRLELYVHTLKHLRPAQVGWLIWRRLLPAPVYRAAGTAGLRKDLRVGPFVPPPVPSGIAPEVLEFLNSGHPMPADSPDWRSPSRPKLWRYNLHYFDYLHWPSLHTHTKLHLIDDWIRGNAPAEGDGWEPYPVSLRVVNWIKFLLTAPGDGPASARRSENVLESLAGQVAWLERNMEFQLLANHLLKNAKALLFAGIALEGRDATRWLERGLALLAAEAEEQVLPDGGHFERSPMYHSIVLEDLLDAVNMLDARPDIGQGKHYASVREAATRAAEFLAEVTGGDDQIPLFNDSAFGIAPAPGVLLAGAERVLGRRFRRATGRVLVDRPQTGYFGCRAGGDSFLIDCGPIGPDYQPGHAHCDTLSYELCLDGHRVIVDSGVHDYENGPLRRYVRSTAAHNTVRVDGQEQSEVWGTFRVARRAQPLAPRFEKHGETGWSFEGAHSGYTRLPARIVHTRSVKGSDGRWTVEDTLTGRGTGRHVAESFIHLHPGLSADVQGEADVLIRDGKSVLCRLRLDRGSGVSLLQGHYCPEFGRCERGVTILLRREGPLPLEIGYEIRKEGSA